MNKVTVNNAILYLSDCLQALKSMPDNSVDSIVTDPPYGLNFMGKAAILEGFKFIGIEREAAYFDIANARISFVGNQPVQQTLFGENNAT